MLVRPNQMKAAKQMDEELTAPIYQIIMESGAWVQDPTSGRRHITQAINDVSFQHTQKRKNLDEEYGSAQSTQQN
jgi:hypothetical protein